MTTFFTSDQHYNHQRICELSNRPWPDVEQMNQALIANHNARVKPGDDVWVLGDFAMGDRKLIPDILAQLNGNIILVCGNHDHKNSLGYFKTVHPSTVVLRLEGKTCFLSHHPTEDGGWAPLGVDVLLHGHVHETWRESVVTLSDGRVLPLYNVGVDRNNYAPVTLDEIIGTK